MEETDRIPFRPPPGGRGEGVRHFRDPATDGDPIEFIRASYFQIPWIYPVTFTSVRSRGLELCDLVLARPSIPFYNAQVNLVDARGCHFKNAHFCNFYSIHPGLHHYHYISRRASTAGHRPPVAPVGRGLHPLWTRGLNRIIRPSCWWTAYTPFVDLQL